MEIVYLILVVVVGVFVLLTAAITVYLALPLPYPSRTESDYSYHTTPWWQIYYCHKYLRPKRRAEKNSGLESYFKGLDFHFNTDDLTEPTELTVSAVGDLMCRKELLGSGGDYLFDEVAADLFRADLSVGNLEFAVNPLTYWYKLLRFSVPGSYAEPLLGEKGKGRFDVVSLANNHINDSLHEGIRETRAYLDSVGVAHTGANAVPEDQDRLLMVERGGIKIAILSYTFSTNGIPLEKGKEWGTNVVRFNALCEEDFNPELILKHIAAAREQGADYIISCHHWGIDLEHYPPKRMVDRAHALLDAGIDLIIGHHPHVLGPVDRYRTQDGRDGIVFYSLGNITAKGLLFTVQRLAAAVRVSLRVGTDRGGRRRVTPAGIEMIPTLFLTKRQKGALYGIVRRLNRTSLKPETAQPLSFLERLQLKRAQKLFLKQFDHSESGIAVR